MRISDWSSDVCSSDLVVRGAEYGRRVNGRDDDRSEPRRQELAAALRHAEVLSQQGLCGGRAEEDDRARAADAEDRKSVVTGKSVSVRVDLGGRRIIKKKKYRHQRPKLPPLKK